MTELFQPLARGLGDAPALIDEAGTTSWRQLDERANRIIGALRARGVGDGATIAVMVGNRREFFEIFAAVCHASWVAVPVNWHWVGAELAYVIGNSGASAMIVDDAYLDVARDARGREESAGCEHWIALGGDVPDDFESFESLLAAASPDEPDGQATGGPMFYTSGTTGFPKGVRSTLSTTGLPASMWTLISGSMLQMLGVPTDGVESMAHHHRGSAEEREHREHPLRRVVRRPVEQGDAVRRHTEHLEHRTRDERPHRGR